MASLDSLFTGYHFTITQLSSYSIAIFRLNAAVKKNNKQTKKRSSIGSSYNIGCWINMSVLRLYYVNKDIRKLKKCYEGLNVHETDNSSWHTGKF